MSRQIALLRGVNVGSRNRIGMADLRELMQDLGYGDARTLLQSGNVVYEARDAPDKAAARIKAALSDRTALNVDILVRTRDEMAKIVAHNPFRKEAIERKWYMVVFLSDTPAKDVLRALDPAQFEPERFAVKGREIYSWFPEGVQKARLTHAFWERRLKLTATARNWNTVEKLLAIADE
jgi:uncharacterized protein (DUF1697 family)